MSMKYIKPRPTVDHSDACSLGIRRVGEEHFYRTFDTIEEAQKFRDENFPLLIERAKKNRLAVAIERKTDPVKAEFRDMKVCDLIGEQVASEKLIVRTKNPHRGGWMTRNSATLVDILGDTRVRDLNPAWATAYTQRMRATERSPGKPYSYDTIHSHFKMISQALCAKAFLLNLSRPELPFQLGKLFPSNWEGKRTRRVRDLDEAAIRESAALRKDPAQWDEVITLALETGARLQELIKAEWTEFDLINRVWSIPMEHTKCNASRGVPLSKKATAMLIRLDAERSAGEPRVFHTMRDPRWASGSFRDIVRRSTVSGIRFHDLRHEFCSRILSKPDGPKMKAVMDMVGHSSPAMLKRYAHLEAREFVESMG